MGDSQYNPLPGVIVSALLKKSTICSTRRNKNEMRGTFSILPPSE